MAYQPPGNNQPVYTPADFQRRQDEDHLRMLSIGFYIMAGLTGLGALYCLIYVFLGVMFSTIPSSAPSKPGDPPPAVMGWIFGGIGGVGFLICLALAWFDVKAGQALARKTNHTLPFVMACINCISVPVGTVLGVFTILTLQKPSVQALFRGDAYYPGAPEQSAYAGGQQYPTPPQNPWNQQR